MDGDGFPNAIDACLFSVKWGTSDHDEDGGFDTEDTDMDNDGLANIPYDQCELGVVGNGVYDALADRDGDGCHDTLGSPADASDSTEYGEDTDDDGDGVLDANDACPSTTSVLYDPETWVDGDNDGCHDTMTLGWNTSSNETDYGEDIDDDNDGTLDWEDDCPNAAGTASIGLKGCPDSDGDAFSDQTDQCPNFYGESYNDRDGCPDTDGDGFSDAERNWTFEDGADRFPAMPRSGKTAMEMVSATTKERNREMIANQHPALRTSTKMAVQRRRRLFKPRRPCASDSENNCWLPSLTIPQKYWKRKRRGHPNLLVGCGRVEELAATTVGIQTKNR